MKFIHASDIHLDSPLRGLERYEGAPVEEVRSATRGALQNLVEAAICKEVDFVLIAGDLYDGDWKDYSTGLFLVRQLVRLQEADIKVFIVAGNHDAASKITKELRLPENTTLFGSGKPQTEPLESCGAVVHGQSFARAAVMDNLAVHYPPAVPGCFNIGLLHTCLTGSEGHEPYAPCSLPELTSKGYDYWALGHVHRREVVNEHPWVVFSGNIQGRHARELGAKGCTLVTVEGGRVLSVEELHLDVMRWALCAVDIGGAVGGYDVVDLAKEALAAVLPQAGGRTLAVRFLVKGAGAAYADLARDPERWMNEIRSAVMEESGEQAWVEKIKLQAEGERAAHEARGDDRLPSSVVESLHGMGLDEDARREMASDFRGLLASLPAELWRVEGPPDLDDPAVLNAVIEDARQIVLERLFRGGEGA